MAAPSAREFIRQLADRVAAGERVAVATVVSVEGSASARPGAKALIDAQGRLVFGWIGGGCAESAVRDAALEALAERQPRLIRLDLDDEVLGVGMPCGGFMNIYVEPMTPEPKLLVLGHGSIAETLARIGHLLEFHVTVNDALATEQAFPNAHVRVTEDPDYAKVEADKETFVVITTQHKSDYEALEQVLRQGPAYVGLVASPKRSALVLERLHEDGFELELLRRVSAPAGLDVGSRTPQEIALSIFAEILVRYRGGQASGRPLVEVKGVQVTDRGVELPERPAETERLPR
ncbi:MAG: XdhC family protein [Myxococcota bacterium]